eukprot:1177489-Prorocentrum_minimum.AAC.2
MTTNSVRVEARLTDGIMDVVVAAGGVDSDVFPTVDANHPAAESVSAGEAEAAGSVAPAAASECDRKSSDVTEFRVSGEPRGDAAPAPAAAETLSAAGWSASTVGKTSSELTPPAAQAETTTDDAGDCALLLRRSNENGDAVDRRGEETDRHVDQKGEGADDLVALLASCVDGLEVRNPSYCTVLILY